MDDSEQDLFLFRRVITSVNPRISVHSVSTGAEAKDLELLKVTAPDLIFLDHRCPTKLDSMGFIGWVRSINIWNRVPIILFSGEISQADIDEAYDAGVNSCLKKAGDLAAQQTQMEIVLSFWCRFVELPGTAF